jgi:hypothetical protein
VPLGQSGGLEWPAVRCQRGSESSRENWNFLGTPDIKRMNATL